LSTNLWAQPEYTRKLLTRINRANGEVLANITLAKARKIGRDEFPEGAPLSQLIEAGNRDSNASNEVFLSFLDELTITEGRTTALPPVLFALDNFGQISLPTKYRDPDYKRIHAHELAIPNAFISFLNGTRKFQRGFAIAATSSTSPRAEALGFALRGEPLPDYSKLDTRVHGTVQGAEVLRVGEMQKEEARGLLDYCRRTGLLRGDVDDEVLAQRYALSSGIAREIVKGCVRVSA
jgi:small subunit ribosomal protein S29